MGDVTDFLAQPLREELLRLLAERDRIDQRVNDLALGGVLQVGMDPLRVESIDPRTGDVVLRPPPDKGARQEPS